MDIHSKQLLIPNDEKVAIYIGRLIEMLNIIRRIDNEINLLKCSNYELKIKLNLLKKFALFLSQNRMQGKIDKIITIIEMNTVFSTLGLYLTLQ